MRLPGQRNPVTLGAFTRGMIDRMHPIQIPFAKREA